MDNMRRRALWHFGLVCVATFGQRWRILQLPKPLMAVLPHSPVLQ